MPKTLKFAMLGMIAGNGHPYSWSAIVNGFDPVAMAPCPYPTIPKYLGARPLETVKVPYAQVTHVWTDNPAEAPLVAKASLIPNVMDRPEDAIGHVDAVFVATDNGFDHVRRARPFVEAGLPVFVDKPLATSLEELQTFIDWRKAGARILSSSSGRYAPELDPWFADKSSLGDIRWVSNITTKYWENYGVHALEPVFKLLGPGFVSVRLDGRPKFEVAHLFHKCGAQVTLSAIYDAGGGGLYMNGTKGCVTVQIGDAYTQFRRQIVTFIDYVRSGGPDPYPFSETIEIQAILIAALRSRAEGNRRVEVAEVMNDLKL